MRMQAGHKTFFCIVEIGLSQFHRVIGHRKAPEQFRFCLIGAGVFDGWPQLCRPLRNVLAGDEDGLSQRRRFIDDEQAGQIGRVEVVCIQNGLAPLGQRAGETGVVRGDDGGVADVALVRDPVAGSGALDLFAEPGALDDVLDARELPIRSDVPVEIALFAQAMFAATAKQGLLDAALGGQAAPVLDTLAVMRLSGAWARPE
ncbi:hypothetical protein [Thiomonas sp.]|uniref:hypothetical protein n=1 Tax=Thiomonas sp. TaxID=2047785 RepID=UPI00258D802B|nr:hypothetical protein [Thiomonas sp.]